MFEMIAFCNYFFVADRPHQSSCIDVPDLDDSAQVRCDQQIWNVDRSEHMAWNLSESLMKKFFK